MFRPNLAAGIKQADNLPGLRIDSGQVAALVAIAECAAKGEILGVGRAAVLLGDDVVDLVRGEAQRLGHSAVFAAARGTLMDLPS
jgi:hypothetical protein